MEYKVFETILSEMAEIMNVIPGEAYRIKDGHQWQICKDGESLSL